MVGTVLHESMAVVHLNVLVSTTGGDLEYSITITPPVESGPSNFMTHNTTIQLSVLYNYEYTMNVVASNCAGNITPCLLYTSPSPRDATLSRMPSST